MEATQVSTKLVKNKKYTANVPSIKELKEQNRCTRCGDPKHSSNDCPHKSATCLGCSIIGYLKRVCQNSRPQKHKPGKMGAVAKARAVTETPPAEPAPEEDDNPPGYATDEDGLDAKVKRVVIRQITESLSTPRVKILINDLFFVQACADTGTSKSIISQDLVQKYNLKVFKANDRLFAANGERMPCGGRVSLRVSLPGDGLLRWLHWSLRQ